MTAVLYDATDALLRVGVAGPSYISNVMVFDNGGAGVIESDQPFDIEAPRVGVTNVMEFDISGNVGAASDQPFDLGEVTGIENDQPFEIIGIVSNPEVGTGQPAPAIAFSAALASPIVSGTSTFVVVSASGITAGTSLYLQGDPPVTLLVTSVVGTTITVAQVIGSSYPAGTVIDVPVVNATLAAPVAAGDTTITLTDTTGVTVGTVIGITGTTGVTEYRAVTVVSGASVTLAAPLGQSYTIGAGVAQSSPFLTGILIADKSGTILGSISDYTINASRSFSIGEPGSMGLYMPRNSPDVAMIKSDRMVAVSNEVGLPLWIGTITTQEWSGSTGNIHFEDAYSLLTGVPIEVDIEVMDDTPATAIYKSVIDLVNARRGLDGEMQWAVDLQGSKLFMGDFFFSGDPDDALRTIADRSGTEYAWSGVVSNGKIVLTLVVRDSFAEAAGVALTDGVGGNVTSSPMYQIDPTTIINGIRITGDQADIKNYVDDWAEWAVHDPEPVVEIYAETGDYRRRIDLDISVDFSLSKKQQRALAQSTQDDVWGLYERYLYALHDIRGTINHEGWAYEGPPEDIEPVLTKDKWHTHVELARFRDGRPAAIVMASSASWLAVTYNITWSTKTVRIWGRESTYTPKIAYLKWRPGTHTIYEESGGRARVYTTYTNSTTETWTVDLNTFTAKLPSGSRITLRGIRSPASLRGRYINASSSLYYGLDPYDEVDNIDTEGSQIGRIWSIEKGQIRQWDPRRDGTGERIAKTTVYNAKLTTRPRWHIVPFSTGEEAETELAAGVFVVNKTGEAGTNAADEIYVESCSSFPIDNPPFDIIVGDPLEGNQEIMRVWKVFGNRWTVWRGMAISAVTTTASVSAGATVIPVSSVAGFVSSMSILIGSETKTVEQVLSNSLDISTPLASGYAAGTAVTTKGYVYAHAEGSLVRLLYGESFDGFKYPYTWPEGEEYARNLLERLRLPSRLVNINVANENDDWSTIKYGSTHAINIQSEGPPGGVTGTGRCIGFSPNEDDGTMEVVLELLP